MCPRWSGAGRALNFVAQNITVVRRGRPNLRPVMPVMLLIVGHVSVTVSVFELFVINVFFFGFFLDLFDDLLHRNAAASGRRNSTVDDDALNGRKSRRDRTFRRGRRSDSRLLRRRRRDLVLLRIRGRTRSDASQRHAVLLRLVAALAVGSGLGDDVVIVIESDADETFFTGNVATLRVGVNETRLLLLPLSVAKVFALLVDFGGVVAVEDRVKHDLGVVAVGVRSGTKAFGVGKNSCELADQRATWRVFDFCSTEGQPLRRSKVFGAAQLGTQILASFIAR